MIKYRDKRTTLTIDLPEECGHEGYSVDCSYSFDIEQKQYLLSMGLRRNDIGDIQSIDSQYVSGDKNTIEYNIQHIVKYASMSGYFEKYIQKYEYTYKCFDKGNDYFEKEKLGEETYPVKKGKIAYRTVYYCSNCGDYVEEDNEFCPHCRVELDWENILDDEEESA